MSFVGGRATALVFAATLAMPLSQLAAQPIFAENFESYPEGSNISGQGGWVGDDIRVGVGSGLGTKVLDGRIDAGEPGNYMPSFVVNRFAPAGLSPSHLYVLSFDAYACSWSCGLPSHNAGVYFHGATHTPDGLSIGWFVDWYGSTPGWIFDARGLMADSTAFVTIAIAADRPVTLQVVLDPSIGMAWGVADFGSGVVTTDPFSFTPSRITGLDGVSAFQDFRGSAGGWLGAEFDNIGVFEDPVVAIAKADWGAVKALFR